MGLEELKAKANELNLEFDENVDETELKSMIDAVNDENGENNDPSPEDLSQKVDFYKKEFERAKERRDRANAEKRKAQSESEKLKSMIEQFPNEEELSTLRKELELLRKEKKAREKAEEEAKLAKKTDLEREVYHKEKEKTELEKELERWKTERENLAKQAAEERKQAEEKIKSLRRRNLEAEIMSIASKHNVYNAKQVSLLTKNDFTYDEDLERYVYIERGKGGNIKKEQDIDEYITEFLSREENENLIRSTMNTESMNISKTRTKDTSSKGKIGDYDPNDPEIVKKADLEGMDPERYIKVVLNNPNRKQKTG